MSKDVAVQQPSIFADEPRLAASGASFERLRRIGTLARQNPLGAFGLIVIFVFVVAALLAPWVAPYNPNAFSGKIQENISSSHIFGTDRLGRDIFSRVLYGGRISLSVAFISVVGGAAIGMLIGIISGYFGGMIDSLIQRAVDTAIAFPAILLLLIITQALGHRSRRSSSPRHRGRPRRDARHPWRRASGKEQPVHRSGARERRLDAAHPLPSHPAQRVALGIIIMTTVLGAIILAEAALSFLGLGIPNAGVSWGHDVSDSRTASRITSRRRSSPAARSRSPCSGSTSWATPSATSPTHASAAAELANPQAFLPSHVPACAYGTRSRLRSTTRGTPSRTPRASRLQH